MCAVTSALGGSVTAPKSQKGSFAGSELVLSTSNAAQPPSLDCMPTDQATPRSDAPLSSIAGAAQREHDDGRVVDVRVVVVRELEREAAGLELRAAHGPVALHADLAAGEPLRAARRRSRAPGSKPASSSAMTASAVSHTGDWHASSRRPASSSIVKLSSPASARTITGMVEPVAERVQRDDRPDPRRLDPAPRAVRLLPLDDPALGRAQRAPAQRPERLALVPVQAAVEERERARGRLGRRLDRRARSAARGSRTGRRRSA